MGIFEPKLPARKALNLPGIGSSSVLLLFSVIEWQLILKSLAAIHWVAIHPVFGDLTGAFSWPPEIPVPTTLTLLPPIPSMALFSLNQYNPILPQNPELSFSLPSSLSIYPVYQEMPFALTSKHPPSDHFSSPSLGPLRL